MTRGFPAVTMDARVALIRVPGLKLHHRRSRKLTTTTSKHRALARWLLDAELGAGSRPQAGLPAAARVLDKLGNRLALLITPVGSEALLRRAVHLSVSEFPYLADVLAFPNTDSLITRLGEAATTVAPREANDGFVAIVGSLVDLLDLFLGERLTMRLLGEVWPELPTTQPARSTQANGSGKLEANR